MYVRKCTDNSTPLRDTGHNITSDTRATRGDLTVLQSDGLCGGCVSCDAGRKPLLWQQARQAQCEFYIHIREKNVDDLVCLDPLNIVKGYVAGLLERPLQLTETPLIAE